MARPYRDPSVVRPECPRHRGSTVRLDGYAHCRWSDAHRRPRYRCVTVPGTRGHSFTLSVPVRQPTERHPDSGAACPTCEHAFGRHEGVRTGRDFIFGHREIARLFVRLGEGMSLREASAGLRRSVFRLLRDDPGEVSRQANLAVNYLDAFAPAVLDALHPRSWPDVIVIDSRTLMTRGYRRTRPTLGGDDQDAAAEQPTGMLKAGTIMIALDATGRRPVPVLLQVQGGKDTDSWKAFFATLAGAPAWVVADLDPAIARAVRETWPDAILFHSRHHLAQLMRARATSDGISERVELAEPVQLARPISWSPARQTVRRYGDHPLLAAIEVAQRGPAEWARFLELVEQYLPADRLELRSWIATNELLIERQWRIAQTHRRLSRSTGAVEGAIGAWLEPVIRRAGRWQNARRLNLVLGLITLRGRGEASEARYGRLIRARFEATANRSHLPADNGLPDEIVRGIRRQLSWWRTWHDRAEPSLPALVFASARRTRQREADDHLGRVRERLRATYAREVDLRRGLGLPMPPAGRARRPEGRETGSVRGKVAADFPDLMAEWDWDHNGDLDPWRVAAGGQQRVAWRCLLNGAHTWETRIADRTVRRSLCPFHMGNRVHPAESLAAWYPWLAQEWHPTKNERRPHQVTRASGREVVWLCAQGHEWRAVVYSRTLSKSGCPECYRLEASWRSRAGKARARREREQREDERIRARIRPRTRAAGDRTL